MSVLWAIAYELLILALGYLALSLVYKVQRATLVEAFALAQILGAGIMGLLLLYASLGGLRPNRALLGCAAAVAVIGLATQWRRGQLVAIIVKPPAVASLRSPSFMLALVALLFLAYLFVGVSIHALAFPLYEWDAFAIWGLKAKVVTYDSLRSNPEYFHDASLSFSHPDYPLLLPFLTAGAYGAIGHVDDRLGKIILPPLFAAYGAITYAALRWKLPRLHSLVLTAILVAVPLCTRWAGSGYADVLLTLFYGASIFFLVKWLEEGAQTSMNPPRQSGGSGTLSGTRWLSGDLLLACLFSVFAGLTKSEGIGLAVINLIVLFIFLFAGKSQKRAPDGAAGANRRHASTLHPPSSILHPRRLLPAVWFGAVLFLLLLPWLLWSRGLPRTHQASAAKLFGGLPNLGTVVQAFAKQFVEFDNWGGIWVLLLLAAIIGYKGFRVLGVQALWLLLAGHLALYVMIYVMTSFGVRELLTYSLDRVLLHATPAVVFLIGYHWHSTLIRNDAAE